MSYNKGLLKNLGTPTIIKKQGLLNNSELYKNMKWTDRISSLILGEQNKQPSKKPYQGLEGSLRKLIRPSRTPHAERSAAGAQGNTRRAREKLYPEVGGGKNVAHNISQTSRQFRQSMAPNEADARARLGAAGRRRKN